MVDGEFSALSFSGYQTRPYSELHTVLVEEEHQDSNLAKGAHPEGSLAACGPQATEGLGTAEAGDGGAGKHRIGSKKPVVILG